MRDGRGESIFRRETREGREGRVERGKGKRILLIPNIVVCIDLFVVLVDQLEVFSQ